MQDESTSRETAERREPLLVDGAAATDADAPLWRAFAAGLVAAIAGAIAWMLIVIVSDYEVGIVAWAIGALAGFAVLLATAGRRGPALQAVAVVAALIGILLGKYLTFWWVVRDEAEQFGVASDFGVLSSNTFDLFREELGTVFSWYDLLWVGLAVVTAWRIPAPEEPEGAPEPV